MRGSCQSEGVTWPGQLATWHWACARWALHARQGREHHLGGRRRLIGLLRPRQRRRWRSLERLSFARDGLDQCLGQQSPGPSLRRLERFAWVNNDDVISAGVLRSLLLFAGAHSSSRSTTKIVSLALFPLYPGSMSIIRISRGLLSTRNRVPEGMSASDSAIDFA